MNTLVTLVDEITKFCDKHKQIQRFEFEYEEQLPNFATGDKTFPLVFAAPIYLEPGVLNKHTIRIYVLERLDRDRTNVLDSTNDTSLILSDIYKFWNNLNFDTEIEIENEPFAIPVNNSQLDYLQGYYADFIFSIPTYSKCDIPLNK